MKKHKLKKHKWYREIKAWANGAEIESKYMGDSDAYRIGWEYVSNPEWDDDVWDFRIKAQPKETKYLYVYARNGEINYMYEDPRGWEGEYIGRIKMESANGN